MYLYFNADGTLKEIINNDVFRIGNQNVNRLFIYWDKSETTITGMNYRFQFEDKTYSSTYTTYTTTDPTATTPSELCYIPANDKRDLKFFEYGKAYKFYVIQVDDAITGKDGAVTCTITLNYLVSGVTTNLTLNLFAFNVENGVYSNDAIENINATQWNALVNILYKTKLSDFTNDSGFITKDANNLTYYTKTSDLKTLIVNTYAEPDHTTYKYTIASSTFSWDDITEGSGEDTYMIILYWLNNDDEISSHTIFYTRKNDGTGLATLPDSAGIDITIYDSFNGQNYNLYCSGSYIYMENDELLPISENDQENLHIKVYKLL